MTEYVAAFALTFTLSFVAEGRVELPALGLWILRSNHLSYPANCFILRTFKKVSSFDAFALTPDSYRDWATPPFLKMRCKNKVLNNIKQVRVQNINGFYDEDMVWKLLQSNPL